MCSYDSVVLLTLIPRIGRERLFFLQQRVLGGSQYSLTVIHHYRVLMVVKRESRIVFAGGGTASAGWAVRPGCFLTTVQQFWPFLGPNAGSVPDPEVHPRVHTQVHPRVQLPRVRHRVHTRVHSRVRILSMGRRIAACHFQDPTATYGALLEIGWKRCTHSVHG